MAEKAITVRYGKGIQRTVPQASTPWTRMKGLIGASSESAADGLLLWECPRIHTHWMQFALDVLYLDGDGIVLAQENDIPPGRVGMHVYGARHVLEIPAGTWAREVRIGERLIVDMGV